MCARVTNSLPTMPLDISSSQPLPRVLAIVGPTASGKSALGSALAECIGGEIIAVDSRTIYRGLSIGTAKPARDLEHSQSYSCGCSYWSGGVLHHGIDRFDPAEVCNVAVFKNMAEICLAGIIERGHVPILVGGTGQYSDAILSPTALPACPPNDALRAALEQLTLTEQVAELTKRDPVTASVIDLRNPRRVARALEIVMVTGKPRRVGEKLPSAFRSFQIGLHLPAEELWQRIEARIDHQLAAGLESEVRALAQKYSWNAPALQSIGYREWQPFFAGEATLAETRLRLIYATRHYAKRQMTWFRKNTSLCWFDSQATAQQEVFDRVQRFLASENESVLR